MCRSKTSAAAATHSLAAASACTEAARQSAAAGGCATAAADSRHDLRRAHWITSRRLQARREDGVCVFRVIEGDSPPQTSSGVGGGGWGGAEVCRGRCSGEPACHQPAGAAAPPATPALGPGCCNCCVHQLLSQLQGAVGGMGGASLGAPRCSCWPRACGQGCWPGPGDEWPAGAAGLAALASTRAAVHAGGPGSARAAQRPCLQMLVALLLGRGGCTCC